MFNIVVAALATLLVAVLSVAGLYEGGSIFARSSASASVDQFINAATQISAAQSLYQTEHGSGYVVDVLPGDAVARFVDEGYLKSAPGMPKGAAPGATWTVTPSPVPGRPPVIGVPMDWADGSTKAICDTVKRVANGQVRCM